MQSYRDVIPVHIMKLPDQYDVILGDAFIRQTCAVTESDHHGLKRLTLKKGNRKVTITRAETSPAPEISAPLLNAMQAAKAIKRNDKHFFVRITEKDAHSILCAHASVDKTDRPDLIPNDRLQAIIDRFRGVLVDELPPGLPPDRGVGHTIPLVEGAKPPYSVTNISISS